MNYWLIISTGAALLMIRLRKKEPESALFFVLKSKQISHQFSIAAGADGTSFRSPICWRHIA